MHTPARPWGIGAPRRWPRASTRLLARTFGLGFAAGCRGSLGLFGPALLSPPLAPPSTGTVAMTGAIGGELVLDKLPATPSRLQAPAMLARYGSGAAGALLLSRRQGAASVTPVLAAAAGTTLGAVSGAAWRDYAGRRGWGRRGALAEDAVALALTAWASRPSGPRRR